MTMVTTAQTHQGYALSQKAFPESEHYQQRALQLTCASQIEQSEKAHSPCSMSEVV